MKYWDVCSKARSEAECRSTSPFREFQLLNHPNLLPLDWQIQREQMKDVPYWKGIIQHKALEVFQEG